MIKIYTNGYTWKPVKGGVPTKLRLCTRCNNQREWHMAWDSNEHGLIGILTIKTSKVYSYKCPICPEFELISGELAKAIIKTKK